MKSVLRLLSDLCSVPTAPFVEHRVVGFIEQFVRSRPHLSLTRDSGGNLLIQLKRNSRRPRWVFTAHMDHPGFIAGTRDGAGLLQADFYGYVRASFFKQARVRFFANDRGFTGRIEAIYFNNAARRDVPSQVTIRIAGNIPEGSIGMFDLGAGRIVGRRFRSRVCDDLAGAAACLAMLDGLKLKPPPQTVAVLLTRAEEEGFIGCIAACASKELLKMDDRIIAIECSAAQPFAPQGKGCILRVGDRTSIFNSALTYFISTQAAALAETDPHFSYQRALMPGGTCEATVYDSFGYIAASVCVALGNYHNMDVDREQLAAEFINLDDWLSMVKLFVTLARDGDAFKPGHAALKKQLHDRYQHRAALLKRYAGS